MKDNKTKSCFSPKKYIPNYTDEIDITNFTDEELLYFLRQLILIRLVEDKLALEKKNGVILGPVHLGAGQEAIAVGISKALKKTDKVFGTHRSHPHILALGCDITKLFAEILGKSTGLSKGMGGSMHLIDKQIGFMGSVPIVGATVPIAVGAALAEKMKLSRNISVAYFGDGAVEEGVVYESLNLAKITNSPVLFVVENNFYASHMHIKERQPDMVTSNIAAANKIKYTVLDGNNVCKISEVAQEYVDDCRNLDGPALLELITYRYYGHVDWRVDLDVGVTRSAEELESWKNKDPIKRLYEAMEKKKLITLSKYQQTIEDLKVMIDNKWRTALAATYPKPQELLSYVYK